jgi:hypothetical protein
MLERRSVGGNGYGPVTGEIPSKRSDNIMGYYISERSGDGY